MPLEIAVPFRLDDTGSVASVASPDDQIRQHVMSLVNTSPGERVVMIDYGVPLSEMLFEDGDETVALELGDLISRAFARYEPGVGLRDVGAVLGQIGDGRADVEVSYQRLDTPASSSGSGSNLAVITAGGKVNEVVKG